MSAIIPTIVNALEAMKVLERLKNERDALTLALDYGDLDLPENVTHLKTLQGLRNECSRRIDVIESNLKKVDIEIY